MTAISRLVLAISWSAAGRRANGVRGKKVGPPHQTLHFFLRTAADVFGSALDQERRGLRSIGESSVSDLERSGDREGVE
jgi:hypothetical protein